MVSVGITKFYKKILLKKEKEKEKRRTFFYGVSFEVSVSLPQHPLGPKDSKKLKQNIK